MESSHCLIKNIPFLSLLISQALTLDQGIRRFLPCEHLYLLLNSTHSTVAKSQNKGIHPSGAFSRSANQGLNSSSLFFLAQAAVKLLLRLNWSLLWVCSPGLCFLRACALNHYGRTWVGRLEYTLLIHIHEQQDETRNGTKEWISYRPNLYSFPGPSVGSESILAIASLLH